MEHTYLTYMRQSVLGSLMQYGVPFFYAADMMTASSFLAAKIAVCRATPARRPCRAGCLEKNHPRFAPVFFSAKPCRDAGKQTTGTTRKTGTELFSIRQRKEAVTRMLDILKETPEYLQVMNHIPAYAMDDDTSEWWNSEESENFMNSLLEVMESYTPDGYRFGPKSGTTDLYGYWESKTGRTTLFHLLFSLESGYEWGKGLSHEKTDAFYKEIKEKFHGEGFDTDRTGCTSQAMYLVKGKTRLYVHPMEISGYCETLHIPQITAILKKGGRTFRLVKDTIAEEVYSFTDEEEMEYYRARYGTCIHRNILDAFSNRRAGKEDILSMMASRINVATTSHLHGIGYDSPAYRFVHEAYDRLVNNGKLKENVREIGCCNIIMAISNTNAI